MTKTLNQLLLLVTLIVIVLFAATRACHPVDDEGTVLLGDVDAGAQFLRQ